jgi:hypothetical protein
MSQKFEFGGQFKKTLLVLAVVGLVFGSLFAILHGVKHPETHFGRFWGNLLINTYYFAGISVVGLFFVAAHQLGYSGWHTVFKRIPLAMGTFQYVAFILFVIITGGIYLHYHHLYGHWSDPEHVDALVRPKLGFLNLYGLFVLGFVGLWALMAFYMNKNFISVSSWKEYSRTKVLSAVFLLIFGVSSSVLSWYVIMSLDPHWYSTLFGWYNLASYACAGFAMMILIIVGLKQTGYLPHVDENHVHDLGKYLFGFSVFWTYLWFSQFLLIWYANIPEATVWYAKRFDVPLFKGLFYVTLVINFFFPLLGLMKRESKRKFVTMGFISVMVIIGHYLDFYQMVMVEPMGVPHHVEHHDEKSASAIQQTVEEGVLFAAAGSHSDVKLVAEHHNDHGAHDIKTYASLGFAELFMFVGFLGLFLFMTFNKLSGNELEIKEDPYLEESLHHHI